MKLKVYLLWFGRLGIAVSAYISSGAPQLSMAFAKQQSRGCPVHPIPVSLSVDRKPNMEQILEVALTFPTNLLYLL